MMRQVRPPMGKPQDRTWSPVATIAFVWEYPSILRKWCPLACTMPTMVEVFMAATKEGSDRGDRVF